MVNFVQAPDPELGPATWWKCGMNRYSTRGNPDRKLRLYITPGALIFICLVLHRKLKLESRARVKLVLGFLGFEAGGTFDRRLLKIPRCEK